MMGVVRHEKCIGHKMSWQRDKAEDSKIHGVPQIAALLLCGSVGQSEVRGSAVLGVCCGSLQHTRIRKDGKGMPEARAGGKYC